MKTRRLFYEDVYIQEFEAIVLSCEEKDGKYHVILNATAFYPEGGGQPADKGMIDNIPVVDVQYIDGELCHIMESPLEEGAQVIGKIDWNWRFDLMQQHSGEHIVSGMIHEKYGYENVGFHMGEEIITIDLSGMLTWQQVQEIEKKVPLLTQGDASRKAYQEAILAYVRESRIALNTGKELPCMPDIRDFATACPDKSYREQVMEEIRQEAESYGMTVEAYVANGYEPPKRGGR